MLKRLPILCFALLALTACSHDSNSPAPTASAPSSTASAPAQAPAAAPAAASTAAAATTSAAIATPAKASVNVSGSSWRNRRQSSWSAPSKTSGGRRTLKMSSRESGSCGAFGIKATRKPATTRPTM